MLMYPTIKEEDMTNIKKAETRKYGELKKPYQFYLTETTSNHIEKISTEMNISRSEFL